MDSFGLDLVWLPGKARKILCFLSVQLFYGGPLTACFFFRNRILFFQHQRAWCLCIVGRLIDWTATAGPRNSSERVVQHQWNTLQTKRALKRMNMNLLLGGSASAGQKREPLLQICEYTLQYIYI